MTPIETARRLAEIEKNATYLTLHSTTHVINSDVANLLALIRELVRRGDAVARFRPCAFDPPEDCGKGDQCYACMEVASWRELADAVEGK